MKKHIIIIEQDKLFSAIIQNHLEEAGYVVTGYNEFPSLAELAFMRADCIIVDEWLPNVSGHARCLMLKAKVQTNHIPVILTSTTNFLESSILCQADAVVKKSCNSSLETSGELIIIHFS